MLVRARMWVRPRVYVCARACVCACACKVQVARTAPRPQVTRVPVALQVLSHVRAFPQLPLEESQLQVGDVPMYVAELQCHAGAGKFGKIIFVF